MAISAKDWKRAKEIGEEFIPKITRAEILRTAHARGMISLEQDLKGKR